MTDNATRRWRTGLSVGVDLATLAALIVAVALVVARKDGGRADAAGPSLNGAIPPPIAVTDALGGATVLFDREDERHTLVFVFRTDCPVCARQRPEWIALAEVATAGGVRVVALTPEPMDSTIGAYFDDAPDVTVAQLDDPSVLTTALGIRAVPTTFAVGTDGRVGFHHTGLMPGGRVDELRSILRSVTAVARSIG